MNCLYIICQGQYPHDTSLILLIRDPSVKFPDVVTMATVPRGAPMQRGKGEEEIENGIREFSKHLCTVIIENGNQRFF